MESVKYGIFLALQTFQLTVQLLEYSLDRSFSVNSSYVLLEKPASVYSDEVHHSISIVAELVSKYDIRGLQLQASVNSYVLVFLCVAWKFSYTKDCQEH